MSVVDYSLTEISKKIYHCKIKDQFDLAMVFCRSQEYYESPYPEIRGKFFSMMDFIKIYSKDNGNVFTYATDWLGFNICGKIIDKVYGTTIPIDYSCYDLVMDEIHKYIRNKISSTNYYLIGTGEEDSDGTILEHELAHAIFGLNSKYRKSVKQEVSNILPSAFHKIKNILNSLGYTKKVFIDEVNAYLSTSDSLIYGSLDFTEEELENLKKVQSNLIGLLSENKII